MTCEREDDVLTAVRTGRWPGQVDAELAAHVARCEICRDVAAVAAAFAEAAHGDFAASPRQPVPDASAVWLRAQLRARADATRLAERPITVAQAVAFASLVGVLGAVCGAASPWLQTALRWLGQGAARLDPRAVVVPPVVVALLTEHVGLAVGAGLGVMLASVAVYWTLREG